VREASYSSGLFHDPPHIPKIYLVPNFKNRCAGLPNPPRLWQIHQQRTCVRSKCLPERFVNYWELLK